MRCGASVMMCVFVGLMSTSVPTRASFCNFAHCMRRSTTTLHTIRAKPYPPLPLHRACTSGYAPCMRSQAWSGSLTSGRQCQHTAPQPARRTRPECRTSYRWSNRTTWWCRRFCREILVGRVGRVTTLVVATDDVTFSEFTQKAPFVTATRHVCFLAFALLLGYHCIAM